MEDLTVPELDRFCFQYTAIELNTAAKPYLLSYLFANFGFDKVVYFDPDILILRNLSTLFALLDKYSIILTPHLTAPLPRDGCTPDELAILRAGTYNLGFIALAKTPTTRALLPWWQDRLYTGCQMDPDRGMHVDQKWVDLIPGFFKYVHILTEPGYNVAYWNLPTRTVQVKHGTVSVNGQPGYFFHFSGINPDNPESISRHSNRYDVSNVGPAAAFYKKYKEQLISYGYHETKNWPYAYGSFENGLKIPDIARRLYIHLGDDVREFGNPFETALPNSYFNWLNAEVDNQRDPSRAITRLWYGIYDLRPDLQRAHPDLFGVHRDAFLQWTAKSGIYEYDIPDRFALHALKRSVLPEHGKKRKKSATHGRFGVNLAGALASEKGVGEAARSAIRILDTARIPYVLNDFQDLGSANEAMSFGNIRRDNPYRVNLGVMGVDAIPVFAEQKGASYFDGRYNIGHWAWELVDFPQEWFRNFQFFDEIWVASSFIQRALSRLAPVPVNQRFIATLARWPS